jgi:hypothetical protein
LAGTRPTCISSGSWRRRSRIKDTS